MENGKAIELSKQTPLSNKFNSKGYGYVNCDLMVSEGTKFNISKDVNIEVKEVKWFSAQEIWELKNPGKNYHAYKLTHHPNEGNIGVTKVETKDNQQYEGVIKRVGVDACTCRSPPSAQTPMRVPFARQRLRPGGLAHLRADHYVRRAPVPSRRSGL